MITRKLLTEWCACWSTDSIDKFFRGRVALSPRDFAEDESLTVDERLWLLLKCLQHNGLVGQIKTTVQHIRERDVAVAHKKMTRVEADAAWSPLLEKLADEALDQLGELADGWEVA